MAARLYETDYYLWARRQAEALRQLERERWNGPLDLKELAEEVDDLAKRDRNACRSQVRRIIVYLLKLDHSPARDLRAGWMESIYEARDALRGDLTPTIERGLRDDFDALYRSAREQVLITLAEYGEGDSATALPEDPAYTLDDVLRDGFYGFKKEQARSSSASAGS
ncbi:DUF29 domain-containing protein [Geminicoccus harenae]|uniref:DUF29 domain-containing protein n=1 Tax=Geminicoccus harenae TaxID=2498453 RepID=UPI00168A547E|nr:DUF29 domain-containing protein [Geminicoccus harenae]